MVANFDVYSVGNGDDPDWVEIKNISDAPVQLEDYWLSDKDGERLRWRFPEKKLRPGPEAGAPATLRQQDLLVRVRGP